VTDATCPNCNRSGHPDRIPHEPFCPSFLRTLDETDGLQLDIYAALDAAESEEA
jgi:hypothetical protein